MECVIKQLIKFTRHACRQALHLEAEEYFDEKK